MRARLEAAVGWLMAPARRRAVYAAIPLVAGVAVAVGLLTDEQAAAWVTLAYAVGGLAAGVMASIMARRVDYQWIYRLLVGVGAALVTAGYVTQAQADDALGIAWRLVVAIPAVIAVWRTDPSTATGEPRAEYEGRHGR